MTRPPADLEPQLLAANESLPADPDFSRRVLQRLEADTAPPAATARARSWRFPMKSFLGLAAAGLLTLAAWQLFVGPPRPAFALDEVPQKLLALQSLHLRGTLYASGGADTTGSPFELFAKHPGQVRVNGVPVYRSEQGKTQLVQTFDTLITGNQQLQIDEKDKIIMQTAESDVECQLLVAQTLQQQLMLMFGARDTADFKKTGSEKIGAVTADLYERKLTLSNASCRVNVWIDPATGLPIRTTLYQSDNNGPESLVARFDTIEANAPLPPAAFTFTPPADFKVIQMTPDDPAGARANDVLFNVRFAIALDPTHSLICWRAYDTGHPADDLTLFSDPQIQLDIRGLQDAPIHERFLRADPSHAGFHWRWSLLTADAPAGQLADPVAMQVISRGSSTSTSFIPVTLPATDLPALLEKAQRLTLPPDQAPLTLKEILTPPAK